MHLLYNNLEIVRRWSNEIHETVQSRATLVQIHGSILFSQIFKANACTNEEHATKSLRV